MKQIGITILTFLVILSCSNNPNKNINQTAISITKESSKDSLTHSTLRLMGIYRKAVQCFPNDSASLYRFYFKWNLTQDPVKIDKQIKRLEKLTSNESAERYRAVENKLKPLITKIVNSNTLTKSQSDSLVKFYSDFDYFSGESLFSQLLNNEDNYNLVWQSFRIMARESSKDTCFIFGLIILENNIRTNAELAEAMGGFVVTSIQNNPTGFLDMYNVRQGENRSDFANYIAVWEDPDKELIDKFTEISEKSTDENYKILATELIEKFKN